MSAQKSDSASLFAWRWRFRWWCGADAHVALRERDLDAGLAQFALDGEVQVAAKTPRAIAHFLAPDGEFEIERALAKTAEKNGGRGISERLRVFARALEQQRAYLLDVAALSHADRDAEAHFGVVVAPVG